MRTGKITTIGLILLIVFFSSAPALSGQEYDDLLEMDLEELMNIKIVTSNKQLEGILESPSVVQVITAQEINLLNFNSLPEILEYATGISNIHAESLPIYSTSTIRGNTLINYQTSTLLLFDGIPVYVPFHGSFDFSWIPLAAIERVEIVKGANSVIYGTNAISAVINVISKQSHQSAAPQFMGKTTLGLDKTVHSEWGDFRKIGAVQSRFFLDLSSIHGDELDFKPELPYTSETQQDKHLGGNLILKFTYKELDVHVQRTRREITKNYTRSNADTIVFYPHIFDEDVLLLNAEIKHVLSDKVSFHARTNYLAWQLDRIKPNSHTFVPDNLIYESYLFSNDFELAFKPSEKSATILGFNLNMLNGRRHYVITDEYDVGADNEETIDLAVYVNGNYLLMSRLNGFYGIRYYRSSFRNISRDNVSSRGALTYRLTKNIYCKALYGESYRVPTYLERDVTATNVIGNPSLAPEKSRSYDLVLSSIYKGFQINVNGFYLEVFDQIVREPIIGDPDRKQYQNKGKVEYQGLELEFKYNLFTNTVGFGGYSYTTGEDAETDQRLPYTYEHMINFGFAHQLDERFSVTSSLKYLHDWGNAPAYLLLNAGIGYQASADPVKFEIRVENILGETVEVPESLFQNDPAPPAPVKTKQKFYISLVYNY